MLYLLAYSGQGQLRIFGPSNEKYHVVGGNDQITTRMANALSGQITKNSELVAIRRNGDGSSGLSFRQGLTTRDVTADRVVLALPFSILRSSVDISRAGFSPRKLTAIREMGMGTNSKMHVQFTSRHWESLGWDVTRAQRGASGILVDYTGGRIGASFGSGTPSSRARQFLGQIEPVLPGISARWNGLATIDYCYPWTKGSYSYWKGGPNQAFAGEHTSVDFQGYLNGAVETGERAAGEITAALK